MNPRKQQFAIVLLVILISIGALSVSGVLQSTTRLSSSGIVIVTDTTPSYIPPSPPSPSSPPPPDPVIEVEVHDDVQCTSALSQIAWGDLNPGDQSPVTAYIKNQGDISIQLGLDTANWNPANAENYMTLQWDHAGQVINPGQVVEVTFTLSVDPDCPPLDDFSFQIVLLVS